MKRKTSLVPTRVYKYGCPFGPLPECAEAVHKQLFLAHRYQNDLIRVVLDGREAYRALTATLPDVDAINARIEQANEEQRVLTEQVNSLKRMARSNVRVHPGTRERIKALKAEKRVLREKRKAARKALFGSPKLADLNKTDNSKRRQARKASGVFWGTYLLIESAVDQAKKEKMDPRFKRWDGTGRLGVQIQRGLLVDKLLSCTDRRLQLRPVPEQAWTPGAAPLEERRRMTRTEVKIRIGSNANRTPVWATFPVILHRPLPPDGRIMGAWVQRKRVGNHECWELCLSLEAYPKPRQPAAPDGVVAIDFGAKGARADHRVALAVGSDGRQFVMNVPKISRHKKTRGEDGVMRQTGTPIERDLVEVLDHADSLRAIADREFNAARDALLAWSKTVTVPEWMHELLRYAHLWRSPRRFAKLVGRWKNERFDNDESAYGAAEAWRRQNSHLYQWESDERTRAIAHRREAYRVWSVKLAREYGRFVYENVNFGSIARRAAPEDEPTHYPNKVRNVAAPGELREQAVEAFGSTSCIKLKCSGRATRCPVCGGEASESRDDSRPTGRGNLACTSATCGAVVEGDYARCWNLMLDAGADASTIERKWREGKAMAEALRAEARKGEAWQ